MRSCSSCGNPFEPGTRVCARCGRARSALPPVAPTGSLPVPGCSPLPPPGPRSAPTGSPGLPPPWERDVDLEPAWEELVGPDGRPGETGAGGDTDVAVSQGRFRWRRLIAAAVAAALLGTGAVVVRGDRHATPSILSGGLERRLPPAVTATPRLRWRATGMGSTSEESANGGAGALVAQDDRHVYAIPGDGGNVLTALDASDGAVSWTVPLGANARSLFVVTDAVVVALGDELLTIDARTGTIRWRAPISFAVEVWPGGPLVASRAGARQSFDLSVIDPSSGRTTWTTTGLRNAAIDRRGLLWTSCASLTLADWRDGRPRWTYAAGVDLCGNGEVGLATAGSTVALLVDSALVGVDVTTGARRWSITLDPDTSQSVEPLDDTHLLVVEQRSSDADLVRVLDAHTGEFVGAIDGHFDVMRTVGRGGASSLLADNGSSVRLIDPLTFAVADRSVPMDGSLPTAFGEPAMAVGATYAFTQSGEASQLASYDLATGARRWQVDTGSATRLVAVGKVLVVLDGDDLVAYG